MMEPQPSTAPSTPQHTGVRRRMRKGRAARITTKSEAPLADLRRRYATSAIAASVPYLGVLAITALYPTALQATVTIGLLIGFGTIAGILALGAVLTWAVMQTSETVSLAEEAKRADDLSWALHLGADLADTYRGPLPDMATPRGPNAR